MRTVPGGFSSPQRTTTTDTLLSGEVEDFFNRTLTSDQAFIIRRMSDLAASLLQVAKSPEVYERLAHLTERVYEWQGVLTETERQNFQNLFAISHMRTQTLIEPLLRQQEALRQLPVLAQTSFENYFADLVRAKDDGGLSRNDAMAIVTLLNALGAQGLEGHPLVCLLEDRISRYIKSSFSAQTLPHEFIHHLTLFSQSIGRPISVNLVDSQVTDEQLALLVVLPMRELNLTSCPRLTDKALAPFRFVQSLKALDISCNEWVGDAVCGALPLATERLSLAVCGRVTGAGLALLSQYPMDYLDLLGCSNLVDHDVCRLDKDLKGLKLYGCGITRITLEYLRARMPSLEDLDLSECGGLQNQDLKLLGAGLIKLALCNWEQLADDALDSISVIQGLRELHLDGCRQVTAAGLMKLPQGVQRLGLDHCDLSGPLAEALRRLPELSYVSLAPYSGVNVEWLRQHAPPGCDIR